ncbi:unnamed protein product [Amoebophrya sp. A120]|nr:unnamed protein product [Amoebophrya sp. A120]|eukprot:GSA120T00015029001.1
MFLLLPKTAATAPHRRGFGSPSSAPGGRMSRTDRVALNNRAEFGMLHQPRTAEEKKQHLEALGSVPFDMQDAYQEWRSEQLPTKQKGKTKNPFLRIRDRYTSENHALQLMLRACVEINLARNKNSAPAPGGGTGTSSSASASILSSSSEAKDNIVVSVEGDEAMTRSPLKSRRRSPCASSSTSSLFSASASSVTIDDSGNKNCSVTRGVSGNTDLPGGSTALLSASPGRSRDETDRENLTPSCLGDLLRDVEEAGSETHDAAARFRDRKLWHDLIVAARQQATSSLECAMALKALIKSGCFSPPDSAAETLLSEREAFAVEDLLWKAVYELAGGSAGTSCFAQKRVLFRRIRRENGTDRLRSPHSLVYCFHAFAYFQRHLLAVPILGPASDGNACEDSGRGTADGAVRPPRLPLPSNAEADQKETTAAPRTSRQNVRGTIKTRGPSSASGVPILLKLCQVARKEVTRHSFVAEHLKLSLELAHHLSSILTFAGDQKFLSSAPFDSGPEQQATCSIPLPQLRDLLRNVFDHIQQHVAECRRNNFEGLCGLKASEIFFVVNAYGRTHKLFLPADGAQLQQQASLRTASRPDFGRGRRRNFPHQQRASPHLAQNKSTPAVLFERERDSRAYLEGLLQFAPLVHKELAQFTPNQLAGILNAFGHTSTFLKVSEILDGDRDHRAPPAHRPATQVATCPSWNQQRTERRFARALVSLFAEVGSHLCGLLAEDPRTEDHSTSSRRAATPPSSARSHDLLPNKLSLRNVSVVCNAFAQVGIQHERWFELISQEGAAIIAEDSTRWSAGGRRGGQSEEHRKDLEEWQRQLTMIVHAYGKLKLSRQPKHLPFLLFLWDRIKLSLKQVASAQSIALLLHSFTKMRLEEDQDSSTCSGMLPCFADRMLALVSTSAALRRSSSCSRTKTRNTISTLTITSFAYALHKNGLASSHEIWDALAAYVALLPDDAHFFFEEEQEKHELRFRGQSAPEPFESVAVLSRNAKSDMGGDINKTRRIQREIDGAVVLAQRHGLVQERNTGTAELRRSTSTSHEKPHEDVDLFRHLTPGELANLCAALGGKRGASVTRFFHRVVETVEGRKDGLDCVIHRMNFLELCKLLDALATHAEETRARQQEEDQHAQADPKRCRSTSSHQSFCLSVCASQNLVAILQAAVVNLAAPATPFPAIPYRNLLKSLEQLHLTTLSEDFMQAVAERISAAKKHEKMKTTAVPAP